jgi:ribosomal protein S18 acetylase RimI-like enzyme
MREIDNSATLEQKDEQEILSKGGAYFVHRAGEVLGIGWTVEDEVLLLAATQKGMGERVLHTLLSATRLEQLRLDVVSTNERAIRFYERLGLIKTGEKHRWYRVR